MSNWINSACFYHIYPLGFCGAPRNNTCGEPINRLEKIIEWIPHLKEMNITAVYLGPVFESSEHGYDTSDYNKIDNRLGTNEVFKKLCSLLHENGIRIVLDGVFNHVGRDFWAFKDVQKHGQASRYCNWFHNLNFGGKSQMGDNFWYDAWQGCYNLVKLNLKNPEVCDYLIEAVDGWINDFDIDGIRLDAADCIDFDFFKKLKAFTKSKKTDFWLMAEIIHGDYTRWANSEMLDSVTNYECYKGLYSSHNDKNYFEIAHSLNRQFGSVGLYKDILTYNFVDNHDVNRLASNIKNKKHLKNVYTLLFTMPGIPSIYYGSEWGATGEKTNGDDSPLRPSADSFNSISKENKDYELEKHISKLAELKQSLTSLMYGKFETVIIRNEQLLFKRCYENKTAYILLNLSETPYIFNFSVNTNTLFSLFDNIEISVINNNATIELSPFSSMIITDENVISKIKVSEAKPVELEPLIYSEKIKLGKYRHFKGNEYEVISIARHSETLEEMVIYKALYGDGKMWVRPAKMWLEPIDRFTFIE